VAPVAPVNAPRPHCVTNKRIGNYPDPFLFAVFSARAVLVAIPTPARKRSHPRLDRTAIEARLKRLANSTRMGWRPRAMWRR